MSPTPCNLVFTIAEREELYMGLMEDRETGYKDEWAESALAKLNKPAHYHLFTTDELCSLGRIAGASPLGEKIGAFFIRLRNNEITNLANP